MTRCPVGVPIPAAIVRASEFPDTRSRLRGLKGEFGLDAMTRRRLHDARGDSGVPGVVGGRGHEMSADFFSFALVVSPEAAHRAAAGLARLETAYKDNVYLDCGPDALDALGVELGEARRPRVRHIAHAELAAWRPKWESIRDASGFVDRVVPHLDRGGDARTDVTGSCMPDAWRPAGAGGRLVEWTRRHRAAGRPGRRFQLTGRW